MWLLTLPPKQYKEQEAQTDNRVLLPSPEKQSLKKPPDYLVMSV